MTRLIAPPSSRTAVRYQDGRLSYTELHGLVAQTAGWLRANGVSKGDRVATVLPNSIELLVGYLGTMAAGAVAVPINDRLTKAEVATILAGAEPTVLLTTPNRIASGWSSSFGVPTTLALGPVVKEWMGRVRSGEDSSAAEVEADAEGVPLEGPRNEPAMIFYTSGSTGPPKGAVYTWATLEDNARLYRAGFGVTSENVVVLCHCMSHNFVVSQLAISFLQAGATLWITDFGSVPQTAEAIRGGATFFSLIPWFGFALFEELRRRPVGNHSLRLSLVGGDRVPRAYFSEHEEVLGMLPAEMIGMTETNTYATNPMVPGDLRIGSAGTALPEVRIEIRDREGTPLPAGQRGQIWIHTPGAMQGYWRDPARTAETMSDGWVATGDIGSLDEDGYLWFDSRMKHMIVSDGDNVYPGQVESVVVQHPLVARACAVGLPHPTRGETVGLAVVLRDPSDALSLADLHAFLADRVNEGMIPTDLLVLPALPEAATGKVDRKRLVELLMAGRRIGPRGRASK